MSTPAQIAASRQNGAKSRGPVTPEGKQRSAQNSLKHGLTAQHLTIPGEDPTDWQALRDGCFDLWEPVGPVEVDLVEAIAACSWRLRRCPVAEASAIRRAIGRQRQNATLPRYLPPDADPDDDVGGAFVELDQLGFLTRGLSRYEASLVRQQKGRIALLMDVQRRRQERDARDRQEELEDHQRHRHDDDRDVTVEPPGDPDGTTASADGSRVDAAGVDAVGDAFMLANVTAGDDVAEKVQNEPEQ